MDGEPEALPRRVAYGFASCLEGLYPFQPRLGSGEGVHRHVSSGGGISLNQLHKECHSRINYKKTCPIHGEVKADDIVSGYEFAEDQYVVINPDELEKVRTAKDKAIDIQAFIKPDVIDPSLLQRPHALPRAGWPDRAQAVRSAAAGDAGAGASAFAQVVFSGKEQVVLLRPMDGLIVMTGAFVQRGGQEADGVRARSAEASR